jgi:hypothetical protein
LLVGLPQLYFRLFPIEKIKIQITELKEQNAPFFEVNQTSETEDKYISSIIDSKKKFDPNTASDEDFAALGFSSKNITTIRNYQAKGGSFKTAEVTPEKAVWR